MQTKQFKSVLIGLMLLVATSANAQFNLGNILGGLTGKSNNTTTQTDANEDSKSESNTTSTSSLKDKLSGLASGVTSIFSKEKQADSTSILGTWEYVEPALLLESDNILSNVAAKTVANKVEDKLQERLTKIGIKPGVLVITFNEDGTFNETIGSKKMSGTWTIENNKLKMSVGKIKTYSVTTQLDGKNLLFVVNADKLLDLFKSFGSNSTNSTLSTITSLMKSIDGMQAGVTLVKK